MSVAKRDQDTSEPILRHILEVVVRLESRLEADGVLKLERIGPAGLKSYGDSVTRFALEHGIEYERDEPPRITHEYQKRVSDWLEAHKNDPKPSFSALEAAFGHEERGTLMTVLRFFKLRGEWEGIIEQLDASGHPIKPGALTKPPYPEAPPKRT